MDYEFMKRINDDIQIKKDIEIKAIRRKELDEQDRTQSAYVFIFMTLMFLISICALSVIEMVFK